MLGPTTTIITTRALCSLARAERSQLRQSATHLLASRPALSTHRRFTMASATTLYDFSPKDKKGKEYPLSDLKGKVVLVVNTASKCGFTPQFEGLEKLYQKVKTSHPDQFAIIGFPCNQFGSQDPGSNDEIHEFCQVNYGVSFPMMGKIDVNGDGTDPVYKWLKSQKKSLMMERIKWNFEKFLIGKDGQVVERWASTTKPENLEPKILEELAKGAPTESKA